MIVFSVLGAPRAGGNTETLWNEYMKGLAANDNIVDISSLVLRDRNIQGCAGCQVCFSTGSCTVKDDMQLCYGEMEEADYIVLATPVYNFNMTGQLKCFIDRLTPFYMKKKLKGKKVFLLATYGDDDEEDSGLSLLIENLKRFCSIHSMDWAGCYSVSAGEGKDSVAHDRDALDRANQLGRSLTG